MKHQILIEIPAIMHQFFYQQGTIFTALELILLIEIRDELWS